MYAIRPATARCIVRCALVDCNCQMHCHIKRQPIRRRAHNRSSSDRVASQATCATVRPLHCTETYSDLSPITFSKTYASISTKTSYNPHCIVVQHLAHSKGRRWPTMNLGRRQSSETWIFTIIANFYTTVSTFTLTTLTLVVTCYSMNVAIHIYSLTPPW